MRGIERLFIMVHFSTVAGCTMLAIQRLCHSSARSAHANTHTQPYTHSQDNSVAHPLCWKQTASSFYGIRALQHLRLIYYLDALASTHFEHSVRCLL